MTFSVIWSEKSKLVLKTLDKSVSTRIIAKVESIKENPLDYVKRLVGVSIYSLRVGDYRVIMDIKNKEMVIFVIKVGHRNRVYDNL